MSDLAKKFMEHSGKDEFGNPVLLFDDKQIKMAIEDGEVLLSCNDVGRACGYKVMNNQSVRKWCRLFTHRALGCMATSWHFTLDGATLFLSSSRIEGSRRFLRFLTEDMDVVVNEKNFKPRTVPADGLPPGDGVEYLRIPGASLYCAGSDGSIWSSRSGEWIKLRPGFDRHGYEHVVVRSDVEEVGVFRFQHKTAVHRLILLAFKGEPFPRQIACHNNGDKLDNQPENLRWGSPKDNAQDTIRHGRQRRGEDSPNAVLDTNTVITIRELHKRNLSPKEIAELLWLPVSAVSSAAYGHTWKHVV